MSIIIGNIKMNLVITDLNNYLTKLQEIENKNFIICPPMLFAPYFLKQGYNVGLQNISIGENGDYTGEVSALQASSMGIKYVLVGHCDRRIKLNETDIEINQKVNQAIKNNIIPILCIGETKEEKELLKTEKVIKKQLISGLRNIDNIENIIICYNPNYELTNNDIIDIEEIINFIKNIVELNFGIHNIKVICGGITTKNINDIKNITNIDGYLIDSCTDVDSFKEILEVAV